MNNLSILLAIIEDAPVSPQKAFELRMLVRNLDSYVKERAKNQSDVFARGVAEDLDSSVQYEIYAPGENI